jgi:acetylornithine deacetylase/succinyl-diaminopimelate desuccinylase-like protein
MPYAKIAFALALLTPASAWAATADPGEAQYRAILKELVETDSTGATGNCTTLVEKVAARMKGAGFPAENIQLLVPPEDPKAGNLVAILPGRQPDALLLLGHIDTVNAKRADWKRDPFTLIEENGVLYGRGVADMKSQAAAWIDTLLRFNKEGLKPKHTVKMALTCGEEGGGRVNGAKWLVDHHRDLIDAKLGLNEGGNGEMTQDGKRVVVSVLVAEKGGGNFILEATNSGGHSSRPRPDNALYSMGRAMDRLSKLEFPVTFNESSKGFFTRMAPIVGGETGAAMARLVANPNDAEADRIVSQSPLWHGMLRTTCVPTMIEGGHAANALPQSVRLTINCRLLPGDTIDNANAMLLKAIADPELTLIKPEQGPSPVFPKITPQIMGPIEKASKDQLGGTPVVPFMTTAGTDGRTLNAAGIPTIGVSGMFREPDGNGVHGLDERYRVSVILDGRRFLYQLIWSYADGDL